MQICNETIYEFFPFLFLMLTGNWWESETLQTLMGGIERDGAIIQHTHGVDQYSRTAVGEAAPTNNNNKKVFRTKFSSWYNIINPCIYNHKSNTTSRICSDSATEYTLTHVWTWYHRTTDFNAILAWCHVLVPYI